MSIISKLKVWIGSDTSDLERGFKRGKKEASGFSSAMKKLKGTLVGIFAVSSIVSFAKECMSLSKVQADAEKKLAAVIKATGGAAELTANEMKRYASQLQDVTRFGDEVTIDAMAIMATFKSIKGDVFKEAIASAQDMATVLNTDLNAAVMQIGKALETPEIGLNALRRSGVSFSQEQTRQIKQLVAEGKKQEAQLIMLKELQTEFGGAAKAAAGDVYGATEQMGNAWGDLKEAIGNAITPSVENMKLLTGAIQTTTDVINDKSIPAWKKLLDMANPVLDTQNKALAALNKKRDEENEKMLNSLELQYKDTEALKIELNKFLQYSEAKQKAYKDVYNAIVAELRKREEGISAGNKEREAQEKLAAEKLAAMEREQESIQAVIAMSEKSASALSDKIKAYKKLAEQTDQNDITNQVFYKKEIFRLDSLIKKNKELVDAKVIADLKKQDGGPISAGKQLFGVQEAAIDVETELTGFKALDQLSLFPENLDNLRKPLKQIQQDFIDLSDVANNAIDTMVTGFAEGFGEMLSGGGNLQGFSAMVAGTFADMAINVGKVAISTGIAVAGIKAALKSLNPVAAIAAGAALVALGTAVKKSLGRISDSGGGGGTFSSNTLSGSGTIDTRAGSSNEAIAKPIEVVVRGELKAKGRDLSAVLESENNRKNLTT